MVWRAEKMDAYALLSLMVEARGVKPMPQIARTAKGKPWFPDRPDLHFSLSHAGGLSLCALSDRPVGVDVELVRPRKGGLPAYALSPRELAWFQERGEIWESFYTLWTMKEAKVKCTGEGIFRRPAREVEIPLLTPGETAEFQGFRFTALAGEGWRGAVCELRDS